jgi:glutamate transport system substrate-binding protein
MENMMKFRISGMFVTLIVASLLAACEKKDQSAQPSAGAPTFAAGSTMAKIQERGVLNVATKFDAKLFGQKNPLTGKLEGFDIEMAHAIAKRIFGSDSPERVAFIEGVTANRETLLQTGKVDLVIATYSITDKRKEAVGFAGPYYRSAQDIMVRPDTTDITTAKDLANRTVCAIQGGTSYIRFQSDVPAAKLTSFDTNTKCLEALLDKRVDAVATDKALLLGFLSDHKGEVKLLNDDYGSDPYGIGVKREDTDFRAFLNDTIADIEKSGKWAEIYAATIGKVSNLNPEPPKIDRY